MSRSPLGHRQEKNVFPGLEKSLCMEELVHGVHWSWVGGVGEEGWEVKEGVGWNRGCFWRVVKRKSVS